MGPQLKLKLSIISLFGLLFCKLVIGQNINEQLKAPHINDFLFVSDSYDRVGTSVCIEGNIAISGAPDIDVASENEGGYVFVYKRENNTWLQDTVLMPIENEKFGRALDIEDETLFIANENQVFVYGRDIDQNWINTQIISPPGNSNYNFGNSIKVLDNVLVVGSSTHLNTNNMTATGAVFVFEKNTNGIWEFTADIFASDSNINDSFGFSVGLLENEIFVGAPNNDELGLNAGATYIYRKNSNNIWIEHAKITFIQSDNPDQKHFGFSISTIQNHLVVGARGTSSSSSVILGNVVTYLKSVNDIWSFEQLIEANPINNNNNSGFFGNSVHLFEDKLLIGEPRRRPFAPQPSTPRTGAVHIYKLESDWVLQTIFSHDDFTNFDEFGSSVSAFENQLFIGSPAKKDGFREEPGAAYIFSLENDSITIQTNKIIGTENMIVGARMGYSVDIHGDWAIVGAFEKDRNIRNAGTAFMYKKNPLGHWELKQEIFPGGSSTVPSFGKSVDIYEDFAIVGAPLNSYGGTIRGGSAYIFKVNTSDVWELKKTLFSPSLQDHSEFGKFVAIDDKKVAITTDRLSPSENNGIYFYENENGQWIEKNNYSESLLNGNFKFQGPISFSGNQLLAGLKDVSQNMGTAGVIFEKNSNSFWFDAHYLTVASPQNLGGVGLAVDISDEKAIIGVPHSESYGKALIFEKDNSGNWINTNSISPIEDSEPATRFGSSVSIDGNLVFVGATDYHFTGIFSGGKVYSFLKDEGNFWNLNNTFSASDSDLGDDFGRSIAFGSNSLLVGASRDDQYGEDAGAAYFFEFEDPSICEASNFNSLPQNLQVDQTVNNSKLKWNHYSDIADGCIIQAGTIASDDISEEFETTPALVIVQGGNIAGSLNGFDFTDWLSPDNEFNLFNFNTFPSGMVSSLQPGAFYKWRVRCGCIVDETLSFPDRLAADNVHLSPWSEYALFSNLELTPSIETQSQTSYKKDLSSKNTFIYPNPNNGVCTIESVHSNYSLEVRDNSGKLVLTKYANQEGFNQIDLGNIASGIYFIKLISEEETSVHKIIVE